MRPADARNALHGSKDHTGSHTRREKKGKKETFVISNGFSLMAYGSVHPPDSRSSCRLEFTSRNDKLKGARHRQPTTSSGRRCNSLSRSRTPGFDRAGSWQRRRGRWMQIEEDQLVFRLRTITFDPVCMGRLKGRGTRGWLSWCK